MSIYDDADNCSNTQILGGKWAPFEPCSALFSVGVEMNRCGVNFLYCGGCESYLDHYDISIGNFGDLHCTYCAGSDLSCT